VDSYSYRWVSIILNDPVMRGFPGQCTVFRDTWYLINAVCGLNTENVSQLLLTVELVVYMFMNCLVPLCVQMDWLSFVVTSEIKYTEQYCYNKERKKDIWLLIIFIWSQRRPQICTRIHLHGQSTCIPNNISINIIYFSSKFTVQNSCGSAPNKHVYS